MATTQTAGGMTITDAIARAAARDAANARMLNAGRSKWNRADYNHATAIYLRLVGGVR